MTTAARRRTRLAELAGADALPERFPSAAAFLGAVVRATIDGVADRRLEYHAAASGANEGVPSEGGFLTPESFAATLWRRTLAVGQLLGRTTRIPITTGDGVKLPAIDESSRANGSRWGGVQVYWVDEADTATASKPKFAQLGLLPKRLLAICYATDELLADAPALAAWLELAFADEAAHVIEQNIISGSGAGRPLGVLSSGALITVDAESGQGSATVQPANFNAMAARLWAPSRRNAVWMLNNDVLGQVENASFSNGAPCVRYDADGNPTILGRPVLLSEYTSALGEVGDVVLMDPTQYLVGERSASFLSSIHVKFLESESTFRLRFRLDGQPAWKSALTPKNSTVTQSAYVTLAARA